MSDITRRNKILIRKVNKALRLHDMISDGDKIAVAVSGGQDSMSLLNLLQMRRRIVPEDYELLAVHVLGDSRGPDAFPPHKPLIDWLESTGVEYIVEPMHLAEDEKLPMKCHRCTWNRRTTLFKMTNRNGCNKLAFGHHMDDMVETALLNLLYQGRMASMYPCAQYFNGAFTLIRPLMYITKNELDLFAKRNNFPDPPPECPASTETKRAVIAEILQLADQSYQNMRTNILRAALNCMEKEIPKERK
ncbi:hypothetical protein GF312_08735 [Candidatus Poribacteria bacterium]|nr:hypothetical protein [Candidatus Poribacteria bacterium]